MRISVITLGVGDLERAARFYRDALGLSERRDKGDVVYLVLEGAWLALYPRDALARYVGVEPGGAGFDGMTLSWDVESESAVDAAMARAAAAGARIVSAASRQAWGGYTGWFADPDGHLWEIVFNPRPLAR